MKKLLLALVLLAPAVFWGQATTSTCSIVSSGGVCKVPNNVVGGMNATFEEIPLGSPATVSITVQGCMRGDTCDTAADTNTSTSAAIRGVAFTKPYNYFKVTASWTGGTAPSVTINNIVTSAKSSSGTGTVASVFGRTGAVVATNGDYTCAQVTNCVAGSTFQVDAVNLTAQTTVNFQDSTAFNGLTFVFTNPSAGNVKGGFSGTLGPGGIGTLVAGSNGLAASATTDTTVATNITTGTLPVGRIPTAIPIGSVGSAGLSGTSPVAIAATGAITCATCATTTNGGALSGTAPVAISAAGAISCATCATTTNGGALSGTAPVAISAAGAISVTGAAGQVLAGSGPAFTATPTLGAQNTTQGTLTVAGSAASAGQLILNIAGASANALTITPGANAGGVTLTGPTTGGTIPSTATSPVTLSAAGAIACATCTTPTTTDTFTNKTFDTAGAGNVFKINGASITANTGSGSNVLATAPAVTGLTTDTIVASGQVSAAGYKDTSIGYLTAAMTQQTTATCTNVTNMTWNIAANKQYKLHCEVPITFVASATIATCLGGPGTATSFTLTEYLDVASSVLNAYSTINQTAYGTKTTASAAPGAVSRIMHVDAVINNGSTASGTPLTLQTAANGTNGITVLADSICQFTQVN